ncbi:MAG: family 43 glycosylhydrolase [Prevotellaceae bacterium]|nr:family 43 glycosylhydrolase [Prevotellaceae bacterium]
MNKSLLIAVASALLSAGAAQAQTTRTASLTVTSGTKYQHIDGFGGTGMNGQWADIYTQAKVQKLWGTDEGQVGLNIMRVRINPNEGNWGEYGNPIRWARAIRPDLQVFATPWTPPKKYKTGRTSKYQNAFGTWVYPIVEHPWGGEGSNGGAINPECYDDYADFLERYRQKMAEKGCPIDMISIQNECDYTPTNDNDEASYESCIYSPQEMAAMVKAARAKIDPSCKVMGPETFGWGQHNYNNTLVNMKDAVDNIDVWGNHLYGTNDWSFVQNVTSKTGKPMWMTEFLIDYDKSKYTGEFTAEYDMVKSIEDAMAAGYSGYVYYNMLDDFFACNHGGSDTELWKRAYVFSHYAHHATGKTRVKSTKNDSTGKLIGGSAYVNEAADTVTVFMLNTSATDTYKVLVSLPFVPKQIKQIVTGETVNALEQDMTDRYYTGTRMPQVQLLPGIFYTFIFTSTEPSEAEAELATSPKQPTYGNPLSANRYMADPTAVEHDGRLYVYATDDQQEFDYSGGIYTNNYSHITRLRCISTADLVNWTDHGTIDVKAIAPWIATSWAPSVVSRQEADGKTHFYLYFTNSASGIGVLTSTSPTGPWTDPLGKALIDSKTAGLGKLSNIIDPGVALNPATGEAYLTFGGGDVTGTDLQPGNARIVRLGDDMLSLASDIKPISAPCHFEANELNYIGNRWVYSYCTRWTIASDWSSYSSKAAPTPASVVYMTASDPLADNWTYQGEILPNPGRIGYNYSNNHTRLQKFGTAYYLLYHTTWLEHQFGYSGGYRNLQMNRATVVEGTARIGAMTSATASITGLSQLTAARVNPYSEQPGSMAAIATRNWWLVRGVNFAADGQTANSLIIKTKGAGTLDVRPADLATDPIATVHFGEQSSDGIHTTAVNLTTPQDAFLTYLYFVLTPIADAEIISWQFSPLPADEALAIDRLAPDGTTTAPVIGIYSPSGTLQTTLQKGINIIRRADGTTEKVLK